MISRLFHPMTLLWLLAFVAWVAVAYWLGWVWAIIGWMLLGLPSLFIVRAMPKGDLRESDLDWWERDL